MGSSRRYRTGPRYRSRSSWSAIVLLDEAFVSRIHAPLYHPSFGSEDRLKVGNSFEKLEEHREAVMRIV